MCVYTLEVGIPSQHSLHVTLVRGGVLCVSSVFFAFSYNQVDNSILVAQLLSVIAILSNEVLLIVIYF